MDKFNFSGTPDQLAQMLPIAEMMYAMMKASSEVSISNRPPISPEFSDYLMLTIYWEGLTTTKKRHVVEKSVRLKSVNPKTISLDYLKQLAREAKVKFDNLTFKTGHCKVKYTNWKDGIQTWGYFENKETGYRVIESLGDLINKSIEKRLLRYEQIDDVSLYDPTPNKISVAGKLVRPPVVAPIATMKFWKATLTFPWIGHTEKLCDVHGYIIPSLAFLKSYED